MDGRRSGWAALRIVSGDSYLLLIARVGSHKFAAASSKRKEGRKEGRKGGRKEGRKAGRKEGTKDRISRIPSIQLKPFIGLVCVDPPKSTDSKTLNPAESY